MWKIWVQYPFVSDQVLLSDCKLVSLYAKKVEVAIGPVLFYFLFAIDLLWSNGLTVDFTN